jgi:hypothetical protein
MLSLIWKQEDILSKKKDLEGIRQQQGQLEERIQALLPQVKALER